MVVLKKHFIIIFFFILSSCAKDGFIEFDPEPTIFGAWIGDSVYYYSLANDSIFLNNKTSYSVFSPPDTFNFYNNYTYNHVFYSLGKTGGEIVLDSGDFVFLNDSIFLNNNSAYSIDVLGFEKLVLIKKSLTEDSLIKYTYKKNIPLVSYSQDVFPIWENMCLNCHYKNSKYVPLIPLEEGYNNLINGQSVNGDYVDFPYYIDTINPENSLLYLKITGDAPGSVMPQPPYSPLPGYQKKLILKWIKQGSLFN